MDIKRSATTPSNRSGSAPTDKSAFSGGTNGATDFQSAFGEQSVGDVLNKISDPNWVDPSKKMRVAGNNQLDKDAFLKLMLAQMKHQDPTNPMQSHEMAAQLAQFTSLEQLNNINSTLGEMKNAQAPQANYQALALIGKKVSGDSSKLTRVAGDTKHAFNFELMNDAAKVKVTVKDAGGNVIRKLEFGNMKKGDNSIEWNGLGEDGMPARPGDYKLSVEGQSTSGGKIFAKTAFGGKITGLNYTPAGPVLIVGNATIRLSDVKKIEDAGPEESVPATPLRSGALNNLGLPGFGPAAGAGSPGASALSLGQQTNLNKNSSSGLASQAPQGQSEFVPPAEDDENVGNIDMVPMSSQLLSQVAKAKSDGP